jgi:hypothetical protein
MRRLLLAVWLAAGVALLIHDALTGGGIAGYLLYREIVGFGSVEPTVTYIAVAVPLAAAPAFLLLPRSRKSVPEAPLSAGRRRIVLIAGSLAACILAGVAVLAVREARAVPDREAPVVRVVLDASPPEPAPPPGARVVLRGTPRSTRSVSYDEVITGKYSPDIRHSHNYVPVTEAGWTPDRPVHFITDLRGATALPGLPPLPSTKYQETSPGVLLADVPTWLVWAFAARGITLAPDARLHTTDASGVRETWYGIATAAAVFALAALFSGMVIR